MKTDRFGGWLAELPKLTAGQREKLTRVLSSIAEADETFFATPVKAAVNSSARRKCGGAACKRGRAAVFCIVGGACPDIENRVDRSFQRPAEFAA